MTKREREPEVRSARGGQVRVTTTSPAVAALLDLDYVYPLIELAPGQQIGADSSHTAVTAGDVRLRLFSTASSTADPPTHDIRAPPLTAHVYTRRSLPPPSSTRY